MTRPLGWFAREFPRIATGRGAEWKCTCGTVNPENVKECRTCEINWHDASLGRRSRKRVKDENATNSPDNSPDKPK